MPVEYCSTKGGCSQRQSGLQALKIRVVTVLSLGSYEPLLGRTTCRLCPPLGGVAL